MQFSTIFSVTALIAAVAAAPAPAPACEATATQTSTINCANTPGYAYETCVIGNHATIWENSLCSIVQTITTATAMCCSSQQQGYININVAPCVKAL